MEQIIISLPEEIAAQLKEAADKIGVKPEELMLVSLQEKLANLEPDFIETVKYVLKKNAELYKRLAKWSFSLFSPLDMKSDWF